MAGSRFSRERLLGGSLLALGAAAAGVRPSFALPLGQARNLVQDFRFVAGGGASITNLPTLDVTTTGADLAIIATLNHQMGLVYLGGDNQIYNGLADSYSTSDDGLTYTFQLRPGLRWSDGSPFTAQDIIYTWNRSIWTETKGIGSATMLNDLAGIDDALAGNTRVISGVQAPDDSTLVITLKAPNVTFLYKIGHPWAWGWVKQSAYERNPDNYWTQPLSNGPFKIDQWVQDDRLIFSRNPYFYGGPANLDTMSFLFNRDASTLLTAYENNELDLVNVDSADIERFNAPGLPHFQELRKVPLGPTCMGFKEAIPPMEDPLMRLAFYQAIDRDTIGKQVYRGAWEGAQSMEDPFFPWFNPAIQLPTFNPAAAKDALARSSYKSASKLPPIRVAGSSYEPYQRAAVAMQQMWKDNLGINVEIKQTEFAYEAAASRSQIALGGRGYAWADIGWLPFSIWETQGAWNKSVSGLSQPDGTTVGYHENPGLDNLLHQADTTLDPQQRTQLYYQAEQMAINDVFNLPLWHRYSFILVKPWAEDYVPRLGFYDMYGAKPSNIWIAAHR